MVGGEILPGGVKGKEGGRGGGGEDFRHPTHCILIIFYSMTPLMTWELRNLGMAMVHHCPKWS